MQPKRVFTIFVYLSIIAASMAQSHNEAEDDSDPDWSYDNVDAWGEDYTYCNGNRQSPIYLSSEGALLAPLPPLRFQYYDEILKGPLKLKNTNYVVKIDLPSTRSGKRPSITGGTFSGRYEAVEIHFHWGSETSNGSEHVIDGKRYDAEIHVIHKNCVYNTFDEAKEHKDGVVVLGIMIEKANQPINSAPVLHEILAKLPQIVEYNSEGNITQEFTLDNILGNLYTEDFYAYPGSLSTPPCLEVVIWHVFTKAISISASEINKFFGLKDPHNNSLKDNHRPLQKLNGRKVFRRYHDGVMTTLPSLDTEN